MLACGMLVAMLLQLPRPTAKVLQENCLSHRFIHKRHKYNYSKIQQYKKIDEHSKFSGLKYIKWISNRLSIIISKTRWDILRKIKWKIIIRIVGRTNYYEKKIKINISRLNWEPRFFSKVVEFFFYYFWEILELDIKKLRIFNLNNLGIKSLTLDAWELEKEWMIVLLGVNEILRVLGVLIIFWN